MINKMFRLFCDGPTNRLSEIRSIRIETDDKIAAMVEKVSELNKIGAHVTLQVRYGIDCREGVPNDYSETSGNSGN